MDDGKGRKGQKTRKEGLEGVDVRRGMAFGQKDGDKEKGTLRVRVP